MELENTNPQVQALVTIYPMEKTQCNFEGTCQNTKLFTSLSVWLVTLSVNCMEKQCC